MEVYGGHTAILGMDMDADPLILQATQVSKAVNRRFRGGKNRQRPPFREMSLKFNSADDESLFRNGNVQMVDAYTSVRPGRKDGLVVSVAGRLFFVYLVNENAFVYKIATGNNASVMHAFGEQAEEWYYVQDGQNQPLFWNGYRDSQATRSDKTKKQMPIGTIMCYAHGRMFVINQFNQMLASDIMFGNGFTRTDGVQSFTETTYWNEGGYFVIPSTFGSVGGAIVMPAFGTNLRGQGELLVWGEYGGMSFDVSQSRPTWKDLQIQKTAMTGRGCIAPYSLANVNGEAWYKTADGWSSYSNDRIDLQAKQVYRKLTREVNAWLDEENPHLKRYASHIFFDNRLLGTIGPQVALPQVKDKGYGSHRFFRGILALDLDRDSQALSGQMNFDGLWTGIRPTGMAVLRDRAFAMSYDSDGTNRLYEIKKGSGNDNGSKKVRSHYVTKQFVCEPSTEFDVKRITGGELWASEITDRVSVEVSYRADHYPCWSDLLPEAQFGSDTPSDIDFPLTRSRQKKWRFPSPDPDNCREGEDGLSDAGSAFQMLVRVVGNAKIDRVRLKATPLPEAERSLIADCPSEEDKADYPAIECKMEDDYEYLTYGQP